MPCSVVYPGTFDPITFGHLDLIKRARTVFDHVVVAVAENSHKKPVFSLPERIEMVKQAVDGIEGVKIESFNGLVVNYARVKGINKIMRGIRMISDFEYEFQMALTNRKLAKDIETVFLMPSEDYSYLSSTLLKEAACLGADLSGFVPPFVEKKLREKVKTS